MKIQKADKSTDIVSDLTHFAWCSLIALHTAREDGLTQSPLATHGFLLRWLSAAQKQKRFPRTIATELDSLLQLGRKKGLAAELQKKLEQLYSSQFPLSTKQSDLMRLTLSITEAKTAGWLNAVVSDQDWELSTLVSEYTSCALLVKKTELTGSFCKDGSLQYPVHFLVVGHVNTVADIFKKNGLNVVISIQNPEWGMLVLNRHD